MSRRTYIQFKDANGGNILELKGWRWSDRLTREVKPHAMKSFASTDPNPPLALDFGSFKRHTALQGRLYNQKQFNTLKLNVIVNWYKNGPVTLTIGTGASKLTKTGVVARMHAEWRANWNYIRVDLDFIETTVFTI